MEKSQSERFRHLIEARLTALQDEDRLGVDAQATVQLDQQSVGRLSRMDALQQQAMAKATAARRQTEATALRAALGRIDDGTFGECEDCGEDIAPRRLELALAITRCIECASG